MPREPDEDLFESTKMTFGEHLEELRAALFKSLLALVLGFVVGLLLGSQVVVWVQEPLKQQLKAHYAKLSWQRRQALADKLRDNGEDVPDWLQVDAKTDSPPGMTWEVLYLDADEVFEQLKRVYPKSLSGITLPAPVEEDDGKPASIRLHVGRVAENDERVQTKSLSVQEPFFVYLKAALVTGIIVSSPLVFFFIWEFVAAGLYPHERRYVYVFMPFSLTLFVAGAGLAFFVVLKFVLNFLLGFNAWLGIDPDPRISEWLGFALILPLGFGISFQLPLVMLFLERIGVFTIRSYLDKWRVAVLVIAVISMLLTPADPSSMILMGIPLILLYFGGILLCRLMPRKVSPLSRP